MLPLIPAIVEAAIVATAAVVTYYAADEVVKQVTSTPASSTSSGTSSWTPQQATGVRRENRIPDTGAPNSTATNPSGTTVKKYGPDGVVQKEYNKGHQQTHREQEKTDHVHDHKPRSNRHPNDQKPTDRQPGRAPKRNELKKDFGL